MIDWVNVLLPYPHDMADRIHGGAVDFMDENGDHTGRTMKKRVVRPGQKKSDLCTYIGLDGVQVTMDVSKAKERPSHDSGIAIQSSSDAGHFRDGKFTHIWVSGSPKPLQRHNLFGTENPLELATLLGTSALQALGFSIDAFTLKRWMHGTDVKFTRIDITQMLDVGSEANAQAFVANIVDQASVKYRNRASCTGDTAYFGKTSKHWTLKLYCKFPEITSASKKHKLPEDIQQREALLEYANGTVRSELVLQSRHLKDIGLQDGRTWAEKPVDSFDIWSTYMQKLELSGNVRLTPSIVETMPAWVRGTYGLWLTGHDVKRMLSTKKNRMTYYRHRKALRAYGVDISKPKAEGNNVVPILRVIEARPKPTPSWAINTPLLARAA